MFQVAVIGGGISGLACAQRLAREAPAGWPLAVLEADSRWGGLLATERSGGWLYELGPDSFVQSKPEALELCRRLGLEGQRIETRSEQRGAWLAWRGDLYPFPGGLMLRAPVDRSRLLSSGLLSARGRRQVQAEPSVPPSGLEDETVAEFVRRRLGPEVLDRFVQPLMAGVYGGAAERLSVRSCLPRLYRRERAAGFVTVASAPSSGANGSPFWTLRDGMGRLIETLRQTLEPRVRLLGGRPVTRLESLPEGGYALGCGAAGEIRARSVVLATPAHVSARLLEGSFPALGAALAEIEYAPCVLATLAFDSRVTDRPGTGLLVPPSGLESLAACTWVHQKFEGRCPPGASMLRAFLGGEAAAGALHRGDEWILERVLADLRRIQGIEQLPSDFRIYRWERALPQYRLGHWRRVRAIRELLSRHPGLELAGNYFDGVGISDSIRHAWKAAGVLIGNRKGEQLKP